MKQVLHGTPKTEFNGLLHATKDGTFLPSKIRHGGKRRSHGGLGKPDDGTADDPKVIRVVNDDDESPNEDYVVFHIKKTM